MDSFSTLAVNDPEVVSAARMVTVVGDDCVGKRGAGVRVTMRGGAILEHIVHANRGTPDNPLSDDDLDAKLRSIAVPRMGVQGANELLTGCWGFEAAPHVAELLTPLRSGAQPAANQP